MSEKIPALADVKECRVYFLKGSINQSIS